MEDNKKIKTAPTIIYQQPIQKQHKNKNNTNN